MEGNLKNKREMFLIKTNLSLSVERVMKKDQAIVDQKKIIYGGFLGLKRSR